MQDNKVMMIIIIVLLVLLMGMIGFVTVYGLNVIRNADFGGNGDGQVAPAAVRVLSQSEIDLINIRDPIRANLKPGDTGRNHVAVLTLSIGIDNTVRNESADIFTLVSGREPVVRDIVGAILRETTYEDIKELQRFNGVEVLRESILEALRVEFATNLIASVVMEIIYQ